MNRRKFFRAAASFVAGCALGLGMRPKIEPISHAVTQDYEYMIFFDRDALKVIDDKNRIMFIGHDGARSVTYRQVDGEWIKHESTRKT